MENFSIPETMKAMTLVAYDKLQLATVPVPKPGPGEVMCRIKSVAICGSDPKMIHGDYAWTNWPPYYPFIMGHEWAGQIVALGEGVNDFKRDTSAMLVYCAPKNGYKSVALTALDNISANEPDANLKKKLACLTAPFICLDGMNEKGVSIAVLTLDSEPVNQSTGKQKIFTTLAIRLVLDRVQSAPAAQSFYRQ